MKEEIIYGIFGGLIGSFYMGWLCSSKSAQCPSTSLAVVDMQALIARKALMLAMIPKTESSQLKIQGSGQELDSPLSLRHTSSIQEAADRLKEDLKEYSVTHNLVLLSKGSVVSGDIPDKTDELLDLIEKGE